VFRLSATSPAAAILGSILSAAAGSTEAGNKNERGITQQTKNAYACIPSLGDPPDQMVLFKDGKYNSRSIPFAEMRAIASGKLDGRMVAVTEIVWNTGGSGNWEIVALFRQMNGNVVWQGVYWPAADLPDGGTMVGRIEIRQNKIRLYGEDPVHHRKISRRDFVGVRTMPDNRSSLKTKQWETLTPLAPLRAPLACAIVAAPGSRRNVARSPSTSAA